ncbi:MAG: DUF2807 domain-containing protein [Proteobacteria bacterium]|nr:DUF2807 domain-containing protein [Pseudomonadota bacterium]
MTVVSRNIGHFSAVHLAGPGQLHITQSDRESLSIDAPDYMLPAIESTIHGGSLLLGYRSAKIVTLQAWREQLTYHLSLVDIGAIALSGCGRILAPDLDTDEIKLCIKGSGHINIEELTADCIHSTISGSGVIVVAGAVEHVRCGFLHLSVCGDAVRQLIADVDRAAAVDFCSLVDSPRLQQVDQAVDDFGSGHQAVLPAESSNGDLLVAHDANGLRR